MDLSIIIVNWNSKDYLKKCIELILCHTHDINFEIIVIDSASYDGCGEMLRQVYPCVQFVQNHQNLGFAKANNKAFQFSKGKSLLFLNPDTEVEDNSIVVLYKHLNSLPDAGIVGARLLNSDRSIQTSCIQSFPDILNQVLDMEVLRKRFPRWKLWGMSSLIDNVSMPSEVESVSGACLMIKREVFEKVGMFSNDFFMYSEDIDLCFKVRKRGLKNFYIPDAIVVHHGGTSSAQSNVSTFSSVMQVESQCRFFRKTRSETYCYQYRLALFASSVIRLAFLFPALHLYKKRGETHWIQGAIQKWEARLRWTLGLERWSKKY